MPRFRSSLVGDDFVVEFDDGRMNLLSRDALEELREVVANVPESASLLLFRSARPGLFAAGADMAEMARFTAEEAIAFSALGQDVFQSIENLGIVSVAMIDGDCFGGALDLAMSFDFRFATERSRFSHPGARLGIVTGFAGTARWSKLLDRPNATRMFLENDVIDADRARSIGLVDRLYAGFDGTERDDLARLRAHDRGVVSVVKTLTRRRSRLPDAHLVRLANHLEDLYRTGE